MALPAELNRYPGPRHVLEVADKLGPSPEQEAETRRLFERMQVGSRAARRRAGRQGGGARAAVRVGRCGRAALRAVVTEAARLRGELRLAHLKYHLVMRQLLSPD